MDQLHADDDSTTIERAGKLNTLLGHMLIPAEVVVASEDEARRLRSVKGSLIYAAMSDGRIVAES